MRKRILFFSAFFPPFRGGAEVFVEEVGKRLARTHEVTVVTARLRRDLAVEERSDGMRIIRVGFGARFDKFLYPFLAFWKSRSIAHDTVYGVLESYAGVAVALYKSFWKVRLSFPSLGHTRDKLQRESRILDPSSRRRGVESEDDKIISHPAILNLQSGTLDEARRGFGLNWLLRGWIHRAPDVIHAISQHLADRAKKLGAKNVVVIPNGIDLARFADVNVSHDQRKIVCVGRLYHVKGQDVLIEAMPMVLKEFLDVKLHLIGDGPEREKLQVKSEKLKVDESIIFRGNLPHEEIPKEIASAAIFVGPSRREGQGIVFVEAMAAGTPVVASHVGGIPEVVEDGVTGLLVPPENPRALAEAMLKLLRDPDYARRLADAAKKHIVQFDWDRIAESVAQLIAGTCDMATK